MPVAVPLAIAGASVAGAAISANASRDAARTVQQGTDRAADLQNQQFQQVLQLAMPGYRRAEGAAGIYSQALGLPPTQGYGGSGGTPTGGLMTGGGYASGRSGLQQQLGATADGPQVLPALTPTATAQTPTSAPLDIGQLVRNTPGYQNQLDQGIKAIDRAAPLVGGMYSGRRMKALNDYGQQTFGSYYNDWLNRVGGMAGQAPQIAQNVGQAGMQNAANIGNLWMTGANARAQGQMNSAAAWTGAGGNIAGMMAGYMR